MAKELSFAVVGLGMGGHHCKAILNAKGAYLAAVCDIDEERLAQRMKEFGCKGYARYSEVLKDKTNPLARILRALRRVPEVVRITRYVDQKH